MQSLYHRHIFNYSYIVVFVHKLLLYTGASQSLLLRSQRRLPAKKVTHICVPYQAEKHAKWVALTSDMVEKFAPIHAASGRLDFDPSMIVWACASTDSAHAHISSGACSYDMIRKRVKNTEKSTLKELHTCNIYAVIELHVPVFRHCSESHQKVAWNILHCSGGQQLHNRGKFLSI